MSAFLGELFAHSFMFMGVMILAMTLHTGFSVFFGTYLVGLALLIAIFHSK